MNNRKKVGLVKLNFFESEKIKIESHIRGLINEEDFAYQENGEKYKGGIVIDRMHVTLFYGLDGEKFNKNNLNNIKIPDFVEVNKFKMFYFKDCDCNALVLIVNDEKKELQKIHDKLSILDILEDEIHDFNFVPHITIAYVDKNFKINNDKFFINKRLKVKNIEFKIRK